MQVTHAQVAPREVDFEKAAHRKIAVEFELKMLQLYGPALGIYALPSLDQPSVWDAIIFVRNGFYKAGKFKFTLHLSGFPLQPPAIYFASPLQHALVSEGTGELDGLGTAARGACCTG